MGMVDHTCNPRYMGGQGYRIPVWSFPKQKWDTIWNIKVKEQNAEGVTKVVQHLQLQEPKFKTAVLPKNFRILH
jgi:hypothetical protein